MVWTSPLVWSLTIFAFNEPFPKYYTIILYSSTVVYIKSSSNKKEVSFNIQQLDHHRS